MESTERAGTQPLQDDGWGPRRAAVRSRRLAGHLAAPAGLVLDGRDTARVRLELTGTAARAAARVEAGRRLAARFAVAAAAEGRVLTVEGAPEDVARFAVALPVLVDYAETLATAAVRTLGEWTRHSSAAPHLAALVEGELQARGRAFRAEAFAVAVEVLTTDEDQVVLPEVSALLAPWEQTAAIAGGIALYGWVDVARVGDQAAAEQLLAAAVVDVAAFAVPAEQLELPLWDSAVEGPAAAAERLVVVVPCSGAKLSETAPAGELYTGSLHALARRAADALTTNGGVVIVMSALHGLLTLDQLVQPYDHTWSDAGHVTVERLQQQAVELGLADAAEVVLLTPGAYTRRGLAVWPAARTPLAHLGIGRQRGRLAALRQDSAQYVTAA